MFVPLLLAAPALAQDGGFDSQRFSPAIDGVHFFQVTDTTVGAAWTGGAATTASVARSPLVLRYGATGQEGELAELVSTLGTVNATAWLNVPRVRLGVDVPLHMVAGQIDTADYQPIGDVRFVATGEIIERDGDGVGLGLQGAVSAPTGAEEVWLGEQRATGSGALLASLGAGPALLTANVGARSGSDARLDDDLQAGARLDYGLGVSYALSQQAGLSAELFGQHLLGQDHPYDTPVEALGSVVVRPGGGPFMARIGAGGGLTRGIGTPTWRTVAQVSYTPGADTPRTLSTADTAAAGQTPTRFVVVTPSGEPIAGASLQIVSGPTDGHYQLADGSVTEPLPAGSYQVRATAAGHQPQEVTVEVPRAAQHAQRITLPAAAETGTLRLTVHDIDDKPVSGWLRLIHEDTEIRTQVPADGVVDTELPAGSYVAFISADDQRTEERSLQITDDGQTIVEVVLGQGRVRVERQRLVLSDTIHFAFDSATIEPRSYPLLNELAATLAGHPELERILIEGHADERGTKAYNLTLSRQRAQAVRDHLVDLGISASRLTTAGMGEAEPLLPEEDTAAYALNRRVEFHIIQRVSLN